MRIITTLQQMQTEMKQIRIAGKSIGFVPTMGFLHEGHAALLQRGREENDVLVLSIFVNPLQFGPQEDLSTYPRDFARDKRIAENQGVDYLFYPAVEEMYPHAPSVTVTVNDRTDVLCGKSRPGHFDGVATVITKLFQIVMPDKAYFGMKDVQQVAVIDGLINDFHFPIQLVPVETVREEDGLAKSSRNVRLSPEERQEATALFRSLQLAKERIAAGERNPGSVAALMKSVINEQTSGITDYIEIYSYPQLKPLQELTGKVIIALAVKFKNARLIDNIILMVNKN